MSSPITDQTTVDTKPVHNGLSGADGYETRADRLRKPKALDVARAVAEQHGVCARPVVRERVDLDTGRVDHVPVPCGSTLASTCAPCAEKNRRLRMAQCREGWHLADEPDFTPDPPTAEQREVLEVRADLAAEYAELRDAGDVAGAESVRDTVAELDQVLRQLGVRGSLPPLDPPERTPRKRSTRRRQDVPNLPRRPVARRTVGRVFAGRYRPSTFVTLTLDSYGKVHADGTPVDPEGYDYRRAARDAVHFARLVDRFVQNLRRAVGWDVQYFATVEPQRRLAPHWHAAIRGAIPRADLRAVAAATYHQVWWPQHDEPVYGGDRAPVWDDRARGFVDPDTRAPLPTWEEALDALGADPDAAPAHTVFLGPQVHAKGVLGGSEEAGRHIGYLTKYLTKSIDQVVEPATDRQQRHADRLLAELRITPCSPRCPVWLLYGVQPQGARRAMDPGVCRGKAHRPTSLGVPGRRVLVSRKWSGKSLADHRHDRKAFVLAMLRQVGITTPDTPSARVSWAPVRPGDPAVPPRDVLLLKAVAERVRWRREYDAALLAAHGQPPAHSSAIPHAA
ncbi:replication initiator [Streptoalloteichus hindustanus]|uniref:Replication initiator protein n=1 Tax=Streptoalloteichus hindustanus TaxID=2017 RepID=A0A1M5QFL7_STRHI|nr:replication initiator [Streptoalloteichus hindustanus]SHH12640.1 hypothetical protein SAMN05444320_1243 [Streptoalloteichus hindustanus]